jgi:aminoglycoside/choline kinase family phosphotransferase/dTDP-glucose pyrophosphorylase
MNFSKIRTAFILGAGLGMRLRPLTQECPKPLLPVGGRPLITFVMDHCLTAGVERFIVNTHHCPDAYDRAFPDRNWRGRPILFRHEPLLLDTAGGLKNIEDLIPADESLLIYNGDILSDLPLGRLLEAHAAGGKEVTLVLRSDGPLRNVALDAQGAICDLRGALGMHGTQFSLFTGIYVVEKRFFRHLTSGKAESLIPVLVEMIRRNPGSVGSVVIDAGVWRDIGDEETYHQVKTSGISLNDTKEKGGQPEAADAGGGGEWNSEEIAFIRATLNLPENVEPGLDPVGRGGSDRHYCRVTVPGLNSLILMRYGHSCEENKRYAAIAGFLRGIGVEVPEVFGHHSEKGLLLMEDLGDEDLFVCRHASWDLRRGLYEKTLTLARRLHAFPLERFPVDNIRLMPGFDSELYRWERDYFREQCVTRTCGIHLRKEEDEALETELSNLALRLLETPPVLVHRDLQSQNVMVRKGEPIFIDFQGMRFGNLFYDLGSLLYDPYVEIRDGDRTSLLRHYYDLSRPPQEWDEFETLFRLASVQRLMQALGAYGFLGRERGKPHFLVHVAPALDRLIDVAGRSGTLPRIHALAHRCRAAVHVSVNV